MGKINVLGFDVANLIAAGEVVDRPASVVKELLENAIDAGGKNITVEIQRGGTAFIRVSDNGCGISTEDLPLAILRHATSKISQAEDLESIGTLGFRGEALAATAAVSKLRILSKTADAPFGALLEAAGGENVTVSETGCANGTTIIVEDLFFNVPARRKFLKKDATETSAVSSVVEKIALSVPDVALKYIVDGEIRYMTAGDGKLEGVIYALYGREVAKRILHVDRTDNGIRVSGYISEADFVRSNRNMENFFINGRFVKSRTAMAAVEQAYVSKMQADKFPFCVLNIELNPAAVDVNVHPSKLEVKFSNERLIFDAVYYTVLGALEKSANRPELSFTGKTQPTIEPQPIQKKNDFFVTTKESARQILSAFVPMDGKRSSPLKEQMPLTGSTVQAPPARRPQPSFRSEVPPAASATPVRAPEIPVTKASQMPAVDRQAAAEKQATEIKPPVTAPSSVKASETPAEPVYAPSATENTPLEPETKPEKIPSYLILGEAYNCYVLLQLEDRLLVVDKHAAHERILYDRLCRNMRESGKHAQILMFPLEITLTESEVQVIEEYKDSIRALGFGYRVSDGKFLLTEIPDMLSREQAEDMLVTMAGRLLEGSGNFESAGVEFFEKTLWQAACKAAIKGGRIYGEEHIKWICDQILQTPDKGGSVIKTCPHGRPVAFEIKKSSIERQFARIQ